MRSPSLAPEHPAISGDAVSVVVSVFNSEGTLPELVRRLRDVRCAGRPIEEIILVDDGSRDASWTMITRLSAEYRGVRGVSLARNQGQHNALLCGIREARGDVIVTLDDDLQNRPEDIPVLLARLAEGADVVYGAPRERQFGFARNLASRATKLILQSAAGAETASMISSFRAFRSSVRDAFAGFNATFVNIDVLLTWGAARFSVAPVTHEPRRIGRSNYTFAALVRHTFNMMTGFSVLPLQLATIVGFSFTLFGVAVLAYVLGRYVFEGLAVQGFTFLASIIAIFSGAQLFALGILGEYLGRMFQRTSGQPSYHVRERTNDRAPV